MYPGVGSGITAMSRQTVANGHLRKVLIAIFLIGVLAAFGNTARADPWPSSQSSGRQYYVQALLGSVPVDTVTPAGTSPSRVQSESVHTLGLAVQRANQFGRTQYGVEWGARLGYGSNRDLFVRVAGSSSSVQIQSDLWTGDLSLGGFASFRPSPRSRLYLSSGPVLYWGRLSGDDEPDDSDDPAEGSGVVLDLTDDGDDLDVTWYARAGVEFTLTPRVNLGLSVRQMDGRLYFGDRGRIRMDGPSYLLTLGYDY